MADLPDSAMPESEVGVMYLIDSKCYCNRADKTDKTAAMSVAQLRHILAHLLGDGQRLTGVLKAGDLALFFDGRSNASALPLELRKCLKTNSLLARQRAMIPIRLVYHNREFSQGGSLAPRRTKNVHSRLPDPLETAYLVMRKQTTLTNR